jgi:inorganic triphosphatase YgiF
MTALIAGRRAGNVVPLTAFDGTMTRKIAPTPTELEIRFHLPPDMEVDLDTHPALAGGGERQSPAVPQVATYFDTPDHDFARHGASLRVRRSAGHEVQTLKLRRSDIPFGRGEWEWPVADGRPDTRHLAETPLAFLAETGSRLIPLFTAEVSRTTRIVRLENTIIELTADLGSIQAGDKVESVRELELELKQGDIALLYRLAADVRAQRPLLLNPESKSDRGWRLLTGHPHSVEKQADIDLPAGITTAAAFREMINATLATLIASQPAAAAGVMDGVHQMRVAIRRLRAILTMFRPHLPAEAETRFTEGLRHIGRVLGEARDWDVFCNETLLDASDDGMSEDLVASLRVPAEAQRKAAYARLTEEFSRPALTDTILGLATWAEEIQAPTCAPESSALHAPLVDLAPALEQRLARKVLRRGRHIRRRSEEELHDLRKALKKLRYAVEFLEPLHRHKRVKAYLHRCKLLQEHLGGINDAAVAMALAEQISQGDAELAPAVSALKAWADERRARSFRHIRDAWHEFRDGALPKVHPD